MIILRVLFTTGAAEIESRHWAATCERCGIDFAKVRVNAPASELLLYFSGIEKHVYMRMLYVTDGSNVPGEHSTYMFWVGHLEKRRRVYPNGIRKSDEAGAANLAGMRAMFKRLGITHVTSTFLNHETDECCIADGVYPAATYLKWWGEMGDES